MVLTLCITEGDKKIKIKSNKFKFNLFKLDEETKEKWNLANESFIILKYKFWSNIKNILIVRI